MSDDDSSGDELFGALDGLGDAGEEADDGDGDAESPLSEDEVVEVTRLEMRLLMGGNEAPATSARVSELRLCKWAALVRGGEYESVVGDRAVQSLLLGPRTKFEKLELDNKGGAYTLHRRALKWARQREVAGNDVSVGRRELVIIAAALVQLYTQLNYAGPAVEDLTRLESLVEVAPASDLEFGGEMSSPHVVLASALVAARALLRVASRSTESKYTSAADTALLADWGDMSSSSVELCAAAWWGARACALHGQALLTSSSNQLPVALWTEYDTFYVAAREWVMLPPGFNDGDVLARLELECGMARHHFDKDDRGKEEFKRATAAARLEIKLSAALGKRTKFQQKSLPQMCLETVGVYDDIEEHGEEGKASVEHVALQEDSILLEEVSFDGESKINKKLNKKNDDSVALRQSVVLALCLDVQNSNAEVDGLTTSEMRAYVDNALKQARNWLVYSSALYQKCKLEAASPYSADRAALQMQVLVEQHCAKRSMFQQGRTDEEASAEHAPNFERVKFAHCLAYPPLWEAKRELAMSMAKLGALVSAAELYAELQSWDDVVECYAGASKRDDAIRVLETRLAEEETPNLLCLMGELKDDPAYLEKAWAMSKNRSFRAARSMARRHTRLQEWANAAKWFDAALNVRPHAPASWFDLGLARMNLQEWPLAARAFSRAVSQEAEDGDSWANLAVCHLRLGDPKAAYSSLERALKSRPDDWRLWENLSRVGAALQDRPTLVAHSINRLLDLRHHASHRPLSSILEPLVRLDKQVAALEDLNDPEDSSRFNTARATAALDTLYARLVKDAPAKLDAETARLWDLCATRATRGGRDDEARELRSKQVRAILNCEGALNDPELAKKLVQAAHTLAAAQTGATPQQLRSSALLLRSVAARVATSPAFGDEETAEKEAAALKEAAETLIRAVPDDTKTTL